MMYKVSFKLKKDAPRLEIDTLTPDCLCLCSAAEIKSVKIWRGKKEVPVSEHFEVSGEPGPTPEETMVVIENCKPFVHYAGMFMSGGILKIKGSCGNYVGSRMTGGIIEIEGDVGDMAANEMKAGKLIVKGNAGNYLGSAWWGGTTGMTGGQVVVEGNVGEMCGQWMEGGYIRVKGNAGDFLGIKQVRGIILVEGDVGYACGAMMTYGRIIVLGNVEVLPTYEQDGTYDELNIFDEVIKGPFQLYKGDISEDGKGDLYVKK